MKKKSISGGDSRSISSWAKRLLIMKLTIVLCLFVGLLSSMAETHAQATKLDFRIQNGTIREVIEAIESQTDYSFMYDNNVFDVNRKVTVDAHNSSILDIMEQILNGENLKYELVNRYIVISSKGGITLQQTNLSISGTIKNEKGEVLPGVTIVVKGTTNGTITDIDGNYTIKDVPSDATLIFSFIGMKTQEIEVSGNSKIDVVLREETIGLDEVVAVGYGKQSKRNVTGSIETVNANKLSEMPVGQLTQKLQGQVAGVQINQQSGTPGQGMSVRIRGQASILAGSSPLYVVDGFPISSDINVINPDEIETITVLKDAAATSLYGSRAANGVVMITTKGAKMGQTNFAINAYYGIQQVPQQGRPEMMNGTEFAQFQKESYEDKGLAVPAAFQNPSQYGEGTDWYDALLRVAPIQDYNITYSKSDEKHSVAVIGGYFKQEGVILNSGYERYSVRTNSTYNLTNWLKVGVNVAPSYTIEDRLNTDGLFYSNGGKILSNSLQAWPIIPYKNADGTVSPTAYIDGLSSFESPNWYYTIQNITKNYKTFRLLSNAFAEAYILEGLKVKSTINAELGNTVYFDFTPSYVSTSWNHSPPRTAVAINTNTNYYTWLNENTATYNKEIGDHSFEILAGFTAQKYRFESTKIQTSNFPDDRISTIQSAINVDRGSTENDIQEWSLLSYISRLTYSYKGKYLFSGAIRWDGSSRFGSSNKWGSFPSASIGWIASEEDFMSNMDPISFLKLRASYGVTGNNSIGNYTHLADISVTTNAVFGTTVASGASLSGLGNIDLGWERTAQANIGVDIGLLENKIQFSYDYYTKKTTDLLYDLSIPTESGFNSITTNVGELKFWGHEFSIKSNNLSGNLTWDTNFNISFSDNRVEKLSGLTDRIYGADERTITKVGERIGQLYGMVWDGVYDNQEEFDNSPVNSQSDVGTIKYKDVNGDTEITRGGDDDDRTIIGNPFPKFIFGLTNSFTYKNFDLSIIMSGSYGNEIARMSDIGTANLDGVFNVLKEVKDRWRSPENPGSGRYGKTTSLTSSERDWMHSRFVHDASYLTVKNVTLGYNMPISSKTFIKSIRIYSSIQQLITFTKYTGANPEVSTESNGELGSSLSQGFDYAAYPIPRTITFGVNLNFK